MAGKSSLIESVIGTGIATSAEPVGTSAAATMSPAQGKAYQMVSLSVHATAPG